MPRRSRTALSEQILALSDFQRAPRLVAAQGDAVLDQIRFRGLLEENCTLVFKPGQ
jgi:hypothetical protein